MTHSFSIIQKSLLKAIQFEARNYHGKGLITPHVPRESRGMLCAGSVLVACQGEVVVKYSGINITGACDRVNIELCVAMLSDSHYYCMDIFIVVICC